jgi:hypothetical protein
LVAVSTAALAATSAAAAADSAALAAAVTAPLTRFLAALKLNPNGIVGIFYLPLAESSSIGSWRALAQLCHLNSDC